MVLAANASDLLLTLKSGAPLIGVSGHEVAYIPGLNEVTQVGERGAYTVVSWRGRTGYVLTGQLIYPGTMDEPSPESETLAETGNRHRWSAGQRVLIYGCAMGAAVVGGWALNFVA